MDGAAVRGDRRLPENIVRCPVFENKEPFGGLISTDFDFLSCRMIVKKVVGVPRPGTVGANK